jgi:fucose permease
LLAICAVALPLSISASIYLAAVVMLIYGGMGASLDIGEHTLISWMHGHQVGGYIQVLQFCYGAGAVIMPLILARILESTGALYWSYWIVAITLIPIAVLFLLVSTPTVPAHAHDDAPITMPETVVVEQPDVADAPVTPVAEDQPAEIADRATLLPVTQRRLSRVAEWLFGRRSARAVPIRTVVLMAGFMIAYVGSAHSIVAWLSSYAVERGLVPSVETAALMNSVFWGALTFGRLAGAVLSFLRIPPHILAAVPAVGLVAATAVLLALPSVPMVLWVLSGVFGFCLGPMFGSAYAYMSWLGRVVSSRDSMWVMTGAAVGDMTVPYLVGWLIQFQGYAVWPICLLALSLTTSSLLAAYIWTAPARLAPVTSATKEIQVTA